MQPDHSSEHHHVTAVGISITDCLASALQLPVVSAAMHNAFSCPSVLRPIPCICLHILGLWFLGFACDSACSSDDEQGKDDLHSLSPMQRQHCTQPSSQAGMARFPNDPSILLAYANYVIHAKKEPRAARQQLQLAVKGDPSIIERYNIFAANVSPEPWQPWLVCSI